MHLLAHPRVHTVLTTGSEIGIAVMIGALLACTGTLASLGFGSALWWALAAQLAAIALGVGVGGLLGALATRHRRSAPATPTRRPTRRRLHHASA